MLKQPGQAFGLFQHGQQRFKLLARFRFPQIENLINRVIGKTLKTANQASGELCAGTVPFAIKFYNGRKGGTILIRNQRAEIIGKPLRQHGQHQIWHINAGTPFIRLRINHRAGLDIMTDIGNGDKEPESVFGFLYCNGIVKILGRCPVNGDVAEITEILSAVNCFGQLNQVGSGLFHLCRE